MARRTNTAAWLEKQKRWQIKVQKDGIRKTFTCSTPGRTGQRIANAKADQWLDDNIEGGSKRVSYYLDKYIKAREGTVAPETHIDEIARIENWIRPYIGHRKISSITEGNLQDILDEASRHGIAKKEGLNKKSIANIMETIKHFFKYCRKNKYTTHYPETLSIPRSAPTKIKRILHPSAIKTLMTTDTTVMYKKRVFDDYVYAYRFAVLTGLRPGELIGMRWDDVDGDTVYLKRSINSKGRVTSGKNDNALRSFTLSSFAREALEQQKAISDTGSVFNISSQSTFRHRWEHYCNSNGIAYVSLYELRHTFVSIAKKLPAGELKMLVGHSKNMDTYGIYSHEYGKDKELTAIDLTEIWTKILG